ncbi:acetylcholinesterase-like [Ptychodera flava]|uniref:acetylcholinesterase-like n=1 Tax=Ptychodera flava TaxID=63121 RepID=UPI00396A56C1
MSGRVTLKIILVFVTYAQTALIKPCRAEDQPVVSTTAGKVRGTRLQVLDESVDRYLGIPYAEPPVGVLRFKRAVPLRRPWQDILDATYFKNVCWQQADIFSVNFSAAASWTPKEPMSEDCLYLNVWSPTSRIGNAPVLVWIHGGSFFWGAASLDSHDGSILAAVEKVVVVTINYRLGAFGFLALNISDAPGNMGLTDQVLALDWIQQNIENFGGDPERVTLVGQSAGAASVVYHLSSPASRHKFRRGVIQSGTPNTLDLKPVEWKSLQLYVEQLALDLGCSNTSVIMESTTDSETADNETTNDGLESYSYYSADLNLQDGQHEEEVHVIDPFNATEIVQCLRSKDPRDIATSVWTFGIHFPVIDGTFIQKDFDSYLAEEDYKRTELLLGVNENEAAVNMVRLPRYFVVDQENLLNSTSFRRFIRERFELDREKETVLADSIAFMYTDWYDQNNGEKLRDAFEDIHGDFDIKCPAIEYTRSYSSSDRTTVYVYHFTHRSSMSTWPEWMGCVHGDEVEFVFGVPLRPRSNYTEEEKNLSRVMMRYWANFARTGSPDDSGEVCRDVAECSWPPYSKDSMFYVTLNGLTSVGSTVDRGLRVPYCEFWRELWPRLRQSTKIKVPRTSQPCFTSSSGTESLRKSWICLPVFFVLLFCQ